jgi:hypothetical protein
MYKLMVIGKSLFLYKELQYYLLMKINRFMHTLYWPLSWVFAVRSILPALYI